MRLIAESLEYSKDNFFITKIDKNDEWSEDELSKLTDIPNKDYLGFHIQFDSPQIVLQKNRKMVVKLII